MSDIHNVEEYDNNLCLKAPLHLIIALLISSRHLIITLLANSAIPKIAASFSYLQSSSSFWFVIADIPALLVLLGLANRQPNAAILWRYAWTNGRLLATSSIFLNIYLCFTFGDLDSFRINSYTSAQRSIILSIGIDILVIYYLWRFKIVHDVFADFPSTTSKVPD